jgi:hypothetical protein
MTANKQKILFWVFTTPIVIMMLMSGVGLLMQWPQNLEGIAHLGYPSYFVFFLGTAKALGVCALLYRRFATLTEWAYAGFTFNFLAAAFSHFSVGDDVAHTITPLVVLGVLAGSYCFGKKLN